MYVRLVTFFAAFFIMCFHRSDAVTGSVVGAVCFLAAILIVWCIWMGWEPSQDRWWTPHIIRARKWWRNRILRLKSDKGKKEGVAEAPEESDRSTKPTDWIFLRSLRQKVTSPPDAESLYAP